MTLSVDWKILGWVKIDQCLVLSQGPLLARCSMLLAPSLAQCRAVRGYSSRAICSHRFKLTQQLQNGMLQLQSACNLKMQHSAGLHRALGWRVTRNRALGGRAAQPP